MNETTRTRSLLLGLVALSWLPSCAHVDPLDDPRIGNVRAWSDVLRASVEGSAESLCQEYSVDVWHVAMTGQMPAFKRMPPRRELSRIEVVLPEELPRTRPASLGREMEIVAAVVVDDGWIVAYAAGEFGSEVVWYGADRATSRLIASDHVNAVFLLGSRHFALVGLCHGGCNEGAIAEFIRDGRGAWSLLPTAPMDDVPDVASLVDDHTVLIASNRSVWLFDGSALLRRLYVSPKTWGYVSSLALQSDGSVLLGSRRKVVELVKSPDGYHERWIVLPGCGKFILDTKRRTCECAGEG